MISVPKAYLMQAYSQTSQFRAMSILRYKQVKAYHAAPPIALCLLDIASGF
jgi:hypothetical protein